MGNNAKIILVGLAFFALGSLGVATAVTTNDRPDVYTAPGSTVQRTVNGETQTGVVESVTEDGEVKRVIRWRNKEGASVTGDRGGSNPLPDAGGRRNRCPGPDNNGPPDEHGPRPW